VFSVCVWGGGGVRREGGIHAIEVNADLDLRSDDGHNNGRLATEVLCAKRHALSMIPG